MMTTELIKISTDTAGRTAVSGRELHEFLGINEKYTQWFDRMCEYGFVENQDFESFSEKSEKPLGGRPSTDHAISINMAKEVCMIQRTPKGKEARQYFIECERKLKVAKPALSGDELILAAVTELQNRVARLTHTVSTQQAKIESDKPKVDFAETFQRHNVMCQFGLLANVLYNNGIDIGRNRLIQLFRDKGDIMQGKSSFTQKALERGIGQNVPSGSYTRNGMIISTITPHLCYKEICEVFDHFNLTQDLRNTVMDEIMTYTDPAEFSEELLEQIGGAA